MKERPGEIPLKDYWANKMRVRQLPLIEDPALTALGIDHPITRISLGGKTESGQSYLTLRGDPDEAIDICEQAIEALKQFKNVPPSSLLQ